MRGCTSPAALGAVLALGALQAAAQGYGYVASFTGLHQLASTRRHTLDPAHPEIQKLASGFTLMLWARFYDMTDNVAQVHFQMAHAGDGNMMQPFAGLHGGWEFTGPAPPSVARLADKGASWHHYAVSWDRASGNCTNYIDGQPFTSTVKGQGRDFLSDRAFITIGASCYSQAFLNPDSYSDCSQQLRFNGELDDIALFGGVLSAPQIGSFWNRSLGDWAASQPDLVMAWDFDDPLSQPGFAGNLGTAGQDYDLRLGTMPKAGLYQTKYATGGGVSVHDIVAPQIVPSGDSRKWATPRALAARGPIVMVVSAGETITTGGAFGEVSISFTAPSNFTSAHNTTTTYNGAPSQAIPVHFAPALPPMVPTSSAHTTLEDKEIAIQVYGYSRTGNTTTLRITRLPAHGSLYDIGADKASRRKDQQITAAGQALSSTKSAFVLYVPQPNNEVDDSFTFTAETRQLLRAPLVSENATVRFEVIGVNDLPEVAKANYSLKEDGHAGGVLVPLSAPDTETGTPNELMITRLPTKGRLYQTDNGQLDGKRTLINRKYSIFEVSGAGDSVAGQYLHSVVRVSSFWAPDGEISFGPGTAGYHALTILGAPDCKDYGECIVDGDWVSDNSVYPKRGQRVLHNALLAYVVGHDKAKGVVDIEYHTMYKRDGTSGNALRKCVIDGANNGTKSYPADCSFDFAGAVLSPVTGRVMATVPRRELRTTGSGGWCPLKESFVGNVTMSGGGAFGPEYVFKHNQADHYPQYTEFIEVAISAAVFPVLIEVGSSRGMGHVTAIKAKDPRGNWVALYTGAPLLDVHRHHVQTKSYWRWVPKACRVHFKTTELRIEVDTSAQTGIADWNYIDYVKVFGAPSLQPAALPTNTTAVVYVPDANAHGADAFEYQASDCPGHLLRYSESATVDFSIAAVNDPPEASYSSVIMSTGERVEVPLLFADVDDSLEALTVRITAVDTGLVVFDSALASSADAIRRFPHTLQQNATTISVLLEDATVSHGVQQRLNISFAVIDSGNLSGTGRVTIAVNRQTPDAGQTLVVETVVATIAAIAVAVFAAKFYRSHLRARPHVMISYSHSDSEFATKLVSALQKRRFKVWIDTAITPGEDWRQDIALAIQKSIAVVFIISPASVKSKYCKEELYYASGLRKPIFPLVIKDAFSELRGGAKTILQRIQWINFETNFDPPFEKLRHRLNVVHSRQATWCCARFRRNSAVEPSSVWGTASEDVARPTQGGGPKWDAYVCFDPRDRTVAETLKRCIESTPGLRVKLAQRFSASEAATGDTGDSGLRTEVKTRKSQRSASVSVIQADAFEENARHIQNSTAFCFVLSEASVDNDTCGEELHAAYEGESPNLLAVTTSPNAKIADLVRDGTSMSMMLQTAPVCDVSNTDKIMAAVFTFRSTCSSAASASKEGPLVSQASHKVILQ